MLSEGYDHSPYAWMIVTDERMGGIVPTFPDVVGPVTSCFGGFKDIPYSNGEYRRTTWKIGEHDVAGECARNVRSIKIIYKLLESIRCIVF